MYLLKLRHSLYKFINSNENKQKSALVWDTRTGSSSSITDGSMCLISDGDYLLAIPFGTQKAKVFGIFIHIAKLQYRLVPLRLRARDRVWIWIWVWVHVRVQSTGREYIHIIIIQ